MKHNKQKQQKNTEKNTMLEMSIVSVIKWIFLLCFLFGKSHTDTLMHTCFPLHHFVYCIVYTHHTQIDVFDRLIVMQTFFFFRKIITIKKNSKEINANLWYNWKFIGFYSALLRREKAN